MFVSMLWHYHILWTRPAELISLPRWSICCFLSTVQDRHVWHDFGRWPGTKYAQEYRQPVYACLWYHTFVCMFTFNIFSILGENDTVSRPKPMVRKCDCMIRNIGYLSQPHHKFKFREISVAHQLFFNEQVVLEFCTEHGNGTTVLCA